MNNVESKSIMRYYVPLSLGMAFCLSGFIFFPLLFIGIILVIIAMHGRSIRKKSCQKCGTWGDIIKVVDDEIVDKKENRVFYVEHIHSEGTITVPDVMPSAKFETNSYRSTTGTSAGPHIYEGKTVTTQTNYKRERWVENRYRLVDYTEIMEKHVLHKKCTICGDLTEETIVKNYTVRNIDRRLGRLRKDLDDELMDYLKKGYPFKSNDPEIDGITYEDILEARNLAESRGWR